MKTENINLRAMATQSNPENRGAFAVPALRWRNAVAKVWSEWSETFRDWDWTRGWSWRD